MEIDEGMLTAARLVTGGAFALTGVRNIKQLSPIAALLKANGFPIAGLLAATGVFMQLGFGVLMMTGLYPLVAALGLLVFTLLATLMVHSFWTIPDKQARAMEANNFLANTIMMGGLLALAAAAL